MEGLVKLRRALLSISRKDGLADFAGGLNRRGVELISTGGTASVLRGAGLPVTEVSELTGFPDLFGGRVKTLHPAVHGPILADTNLEAHRQALRRHGLAEIDLVAVGLYPFEETVRSGAGMSECVEQIDVGGPALIRAAAKNHARVAVVTQPDQYALITEALDACDGATALDLRRRLAASAFARTAAYDAAIAVWAQGNWSRDWPDRLLVAAEIGAVLRYGENPHQRAAVYRAGTRRGAVSARRLQGKACSYNNLADADAAFEAVAEFPRSDGCACVIVKHTNPCGVAVRKTVAEAFEAARLADPDSAFGGVVAFNAPVECAAAELLSARFLEVVIAPEFDEASLPVLGARPALRLLQTGGLPTREEQVRCVRSVAGGYLVQERDRASAEDLSMRVMTRRAPDSGEWQSLQFAWRVVKHVKSNAIVLAREAATIGVGAGQMSRVDAVRSAVAKGVSTGALATSGGVGRLRSVLASDAFFPFPDGVEIAAEAGIQAIIQPGGAKRDAEVVRAADAAGIAMVFTGERNFRH